MHFMGLDGYCLAREELARGIEGGELELVKDVIMGERWDIAHDVGTLRNFGCGRLGLGPG